MRLLLAAALLACPGLAMADPTETLLRDLSNAPGPSGFEEAVRAIMVPRMKAASEDLRYDGLGSVIARQGSSGPRVMLDAHMDELGGVLRRVTPDGFLSMQMLGGWLDQALAGQRWVIIGSKGPVHAVSSIRDIHLAAAEERGSLIKRDAVFLDVGAGSAAEVAALGIAPGDPVVPDSGFEVLNGTANYAGKAWDDRVGCAVLLMAMERLKVTGHPNQIFFVATVQEEIGLRGARTATAIVKPDIGIAIEGGVTGDAGGAHPEESQVKLGHGPGLFLYDSSALPNRKLVSLIRKVAGEAGVPLQFDLVQGYGDDSAEMQTVAGGAPTVNLVVPARYTHVHTGVINRHDFDQTVDLVVALLRRLDAKTVADLRDFTP
ncbi:M42 family metallopeptidase [Novosphingobium acidiphilum]|uniref:M42 family metallopeptidase n=1 Tax=Novosphingobium acidiphilum TaxID=505248 RepID=UPI0004091424|nr:M42 family metallopeptidase [Novosphingobium acidiphilum]